MNCSLSCTRRESFSCHSLCCQTQLPLLGSSRRPCTLEIESPFLRKRGVIFIEVVSRRVTMSENQTKRPKGGQHIKLIIVKITPSINNV